MGPGMVKFYDPCEVRKMKKVIVLGSLNMDLTIQCVDLPKNGETINGSDFFVNPGGKGGNQAVAAASWGPNAYDCQYRQ